MIQILIPLIIIYAVVLGLSTIFAGYLWYAYKHELLKLTFFLWLAVTISFLAQGAFATLDLFGLLGFSSNIGIVIILLILSDKTSDDKSLPIRRLVGTTAIGFVVSLVLISLNFSYPISSFPIAASFAVVLIIAAFKKSRKAPCLIGYKVLLVLTALHFLDYPFLRPNPQLAIFGFSMGLFFAFSYSIIIPLFVMKIITDSHANMLEETVKTRTSQLNEAVLNLSKVNLELENANTELNAVSSQNRNLLSVLVHDLSNPINVIMAAVKNVKVQDLGEKDTKWISMIDRSIWTIRNTISHVGTFHLTRFGKVSIQTGTVDLVKLFDSIKEDFRHDLTKKSLSFHLLTEKKDETFFVVAEEQRLKNQIIGNLVSNAIKFSNTGSKIEISISNSKESVTILVRDFGVGIPKEKLKSLFSSNEPTSTFGTEGEKGMGLGLQIAKYFAKAMGGDIRHVSLNEPGCCFEIALKNAI